MLESAGRKTAGQTHLKLVLGLILWLTALRLCWNYNYVGAQNDDAVYWWIAYRLAQDHAITTVEAFLPGWPLLASPLFYLGGDSTLWMRLLSVSLAIGAWALLYRLLRRRWAMGWAMALSFQYLWTAVSLRAASVMMSDHCFSFLVFLGLELLDSTRSVASEPRHTRKAWTVDVLAGLVCGYSALVRVVGLPIALALAIALAIRREWAKCGRFALGVTISAGLALPYLATYLVVGARNSTLIPSIPRPLLLVAAAEFLGLPATPIVSVFMWALVILGLIGLIRSVRRRGLEPIDMVLPGHLALQLFWPFPAGRYFLIDWPLILHYACLALWVRSRIALLVAIYLSSIRALWNLIVFAQIQASAVPARLENFRWIDQNLPSDAVVASIGPMRIQLQAHRKGAAVPLTGEFSDYVFHLCRLKADYVLEEPYSFRTSTTGYPARLDLWFERSTLFQLVHETPYDRLFQWRGDRHKFMVAYRAFHSSGQLASKRNYLSAILKCDEALALVPDFPEARVLRVWLTLQAHGSSGLKRQDLELLETEANQYPHDFAAARLIAEIHRLQGRKERARQVLSRALQESERSGFPPSDTAGLRAEQPAAGH